MSHHPPCYHRFSGFSLIEAAIVLGVVGLVIGGIWVAASAVNDHMRWRQTEDGWVYLINYIGKTYRRSAMATMATTIDIESAIRAGTALPAGWSCCGPYGSIKDPYGNNLFIQAGPSSFSMSYTDQTTDKNFCVRWSVLMFNRVFGRIINPTYFNYSTAPNYASCMSGALSSYAITSTTSVPFTHFEQYCCPSESLGFYASYPNQ